MQQPQRSIEEIDEIRARDPRRARFPLNVQPRLD